MDNLNLRKKLLHQSKNCGTRESCFILGDFAKENIFHLTKKQLSQYQLLLNLPDSEILERISQHDIMDILNQNREIMSNVTIEIQQTKEGQDLPLPKYETEQSAGMDLMASINEEIVIRPGQRMIIPTGIMIALPAHYEAQIRPRSGLAAKHGLTVLNTPGTIDADYRGEIKAILINLGEEDFTITRGMRIAQMIIAPCIQSEWKVVAEINSDTKRGAGGFGSTGTK